MSGIEVSAVVMRNKIGRVLHVRKRGTTALMLPGGKPEPGEAPHETASREFAEELGTDLDPQQLTYLGSFTEPAANEPGRDVTGHVYTHPLVAIGSPLAEIDHLEWIDPENPPVTTAPLSLRVFTVLG